MHTCNDVFQIVGRFLTVVGGDTDHGTALVGVFTSQRQFEIYPA
jgi:hypothetical protein